MKEHIRLTKIWNKTFLSKIRAAIKAVKKSEKWQNYSDSKILELLRGYISPVHACGYFIRILPNNDQKNIIPTNSWLLKLYKSSKGE